MSRDDFFEQLARDHYPGPRPVYDGPDGTARRPSRHASRPIRPERKANADPGRSRGPAAVALAAIALCGVTVFLVVQDSQRPDDVAGARAAPATAVPARAIPAETSQHPSRFGRARLARPRTPRRGAARGSPMRRPRPPRHLHRSQPARRSATARVTPVATPRVTATAVTTVAPAAATAPRAVAPSAPRPASEPSCEFPPC